MLKNDITVGIISNEDYMPSRLAGKHIRNVLNRASIKNVFFSLQDILSGKFFGEVFFNVYYGEIGDGGIISGILERKGVKFIGNNQLTCSLMLNKIVAKMIFKLYDYETPNFWYKPSPSVTNTELMNEIKQATRFPIMIKPVNGAVSEGIHFMQREEELGEFIKSNRILLDSGHYFIEEFIFGIELTAGYVNSINKLLPVIEIGLKEEKFQSNEVKLNSELKENKVPAEIDMEIYEKAQRIARDLNEIFYCDYFSRTDMIYREEDQKIYVLEVNSNPGLLENSLLPLAVKKSGISEEEFFTGLINYSFKEDIGRDFTFSI